MKFTSAAIATSAVLLGLVAEAVSFVTQTTCDGLTYTYEEMAGLGFVASDARDEFGDTMGGWGSAMAMDRKAWKKNPDGSYTGIVYTLPDRGWNTEGTVNFQSRIHRFQIDFTPRPTATVANPSGQNLIFTYVNTILLYGPDGTTPTTGLDADAKAVLRFPGFPDLPAAFWDGNGFGGPGGPGLDGPGISIDSEGLVLAEDGSFWVSDEYGPYIYHFDPSGVMLKAIRPPEAFIPRRNGAESFSANSPPLFNNTAIPIPGDPTTGRNNNQGLEGLAQSGDGNNLYGLMQSALNQDGGPAKTTNRHARLLKYDIRNNGARYAEEFVVRLPQWVDPNAKPSANPKTAAQSEIFSLGNSQFFVLARDSGRGLGQPSPLSIYRHIDIFSISKATNIKSPQYDCATCSITTTATSGVLKNGITPATYCPFIDINDNSQLLRFGVHNGIPSGTNLSGLLNEKWESLGIVPVDGKVGDDDEWFLFAFSDNDFVTQNGFMGFGTFPYKDDSGFNLDNQALVFKIKLPAHSRPFDRDD